jgi:hypothetical protein
MPVVIAVIGIAVVAWGIIIAAIMIAAVVTIWAFSPTMIVSIVPMRSTLIGSPV